MGILDRKRKVTQLRGRAPAWNAEGSQDLSPVSAVKDSQVEVDVKDCSPDKSLKSKYQ